MTQSAEQFFKTYAHANAASNLALIGTFYADNSSSPVRTALSLSGRKTSSKFFRE